MEVYKIPLMKDQLVPKEVKRVEMLTGKYKGEVKDFLHYTNDKAVVHLDVGKMGCYSKHNIKFVESEYILVPEFY